MRKSVLIIMAFVCALTNAFAQNALYVHQKDGTITKVDISNINGIRFTKFDANSNQCDDYVSHEITTSDNVYKHAISEIEYVSFSAPVAKITTGEVSDISYNSATVELVFENVYVGQVCGVELISSKSKTPFDLGYIKGVTAYTFTDLEEKTEYTCRAYVETDGQKTYGNIKMFTTTEKPIPDISGTWYCVQEKWNSITQKTTYETYTLILNKDGSVETSRYSSIVSGSWSLDSKGELFIKIDTLATQTQSSGTHWSFTADNPDNPTSFSGYVYGWTVHSSSGYHQSDRSNCELSR